MHTFIALIFSIAMPAIAAAQNQGFAPVPAAPEFTPSDATAYGRQLMDYADRFDSGWADEVLRGEMTLVDASGRSVRRTFVRMALERGEDGDKVITRFTSPNDIRGVSVLTFENRGGSDDNWLYLPSTKRVRRISGANNTSSFLGTEFTYEDLTPLDPREYDFTYLGEAALNVDGTELTTRQIEAVPTYDDTGYSRLVISLDPTSWIHVKIDYYDLSGTLLKTRHSASIETFHDRFWRARRIEMANHQTGKRTVLEITDYYVNVASYADSRTGEPRRSLSEAMFTTRSLSN